MCPPPPPPNSQLLDARMKNRGENGGGGGKLGSQIDLGTLCLIQQCEVRKNFDKL